MASALEAALQRKMSYGVRGPLQGAAWERERGASLADFSEAKFDYYMEGAPRDEELSSTHLQIPESPYEIGHRVWDCCTLMCKMFEKNPQFVSGKRVLEFGAGTGLLALVVHRLGATSVLCTEYGRVVEHMRTVIAANLGTAARPETLTTCLLDWTEPELPTEVIDLSPEVIISADITLAPQDAPWIAGLLRRLSEMAPTAEILIGCTTIREGYKPFLEAIAGDFQVETMPAEELHPDYRTERHVVLRLFRRKHANGSGYGDSTTEG